MKKTTVKFELPCIICSDDYHELKIFAQSLSKLTNTKIKSFELPKKFDGQYYGVLYTGERPTSSEITELEKEVIYL